MLGYKTERILRLICMFQEIDTYELIFLLISFGLEVDFGIRSEQEESGSVIHPAASMSCFEEVKWATMAREHSRE